MSNLSVRKELQREAVALPKKNQNLARRLIVITRKGQDEYTIRPCTLRNRLPKCYLEQNPLRDIVHQGLPSDMMGAFS